MLIFNHDSIIQMAHALLKLKVQALRGRGKSIREIVSTLKVPASSVSYWCRDIHLSKTQQARLAKKQRDRAYAGRLKAAELARARRIEISQKLRNEGIGEMSNLGEREFFVAGIGLYWGEGYRRQEQIGFTSSDEKIVRFMMAWFRKFLRAENGDFILRVSVNAGHRDRIRIIERFWSRVTGISHHQFTRPSFIQARSRKVYFSRESYYGTLRFTLRKSVVQHRKFMGWIEGLYQHMPA